MNIAKIMVSVLAVVIMLMAVAIPIISTMSENTGTPEYEDNATYDYKMAKSTKLTSAITIAKTADGYTVNGAAATSGTAVVADTIAIQITTGVGWLYTDGETTTMSQTAWTTGDTLVFNANSWTYTPDDDSEASAASGTFSWIYYPDTSGTYVKATTGVYVDSDSEIVTYGLLSTTKQCVTTGTIDDLEILYANGVIGGTAITVDSTESDYTNSVTSVKVGNATVGQNLIVPLKYTSDIEPSLTTNLVNIIPVILVAALIIGIVYAALLRRSEEY